MTPRILVIKSRHIGDVLLTAPLFSALRQHYPHALLVALVKPETAPMLENHPHINAVWTFPMRQPKESTLVFARRWLRWLVQLRGMKFQWVINTTEGDRGILTAFLSGAKKRTGLVNGNKRSQIWRRWLLTHTPPVQPGARHTVIGNLDLLPDDIAPRPRPKVHLGVLPETTLQVRQLLQQQGWDTRSPLAQVHPVTRWFFKCWTDQGMAQVIDHLDQRGFTVVVTSGPEPREMEKCQRILTLCHSRPLLLAGRLSLKQTAALSAMSRLFFGVDTAPMHMAAAMDIPVVALFGPSSVPLWGPWPNDWPKPNSPYPAPRGNQQAGIHSVIQKKWECVPCCRDGCQGSKKSQCLEELPFEEVIPTLNRVVENLQSNGL